MGLQSSILGMKKMWNLIPQTVRMKHFWELLWWSSRSMIFDLGLQGPQHQVLSAGTISTMHQIIMEWWKRVLLIILGMCRLNEIISIVVFTDWISGSRSWREILIPGSKTPARQTWRFFGQLRCAKFVDLFKRAWGVQNFARFCLLQTLS